MATPSAVPSSPKVKTGPSLILHPFSFQGQPLPPWPSSTEALRPQWFQPGEGLSLSWAGSSGPQTGFPTLTRAGTSPHGSLPPTAPCSSSSLHLGMLRGGYPGCLFCLLPVLGVVPSRKAKPLCVSYFKTRGWSDLAFHTPGTQGSLLGLEGFKAKSRKQLEVHLPSPPPPI